MKVTGLNGREYNLKLSRYLVDGEDCRKRSTPHLRARSLLFDLFKGQMILEEVKLPGSRDSSKKSTLFLDFLLPNLNIGVEVHGEQHYKYIAFFHKTRAGFATCLRRDDLKQKWCELNGIDLIVLKHSDNEDEWRERLGYGR